MTDQGDSASRFPTVFSPIRLRQTLVRNRVVITSHATARRARLMPSSADSIQVIQARLLSIPWIQENRREPGY